MDETTLTAGSQAAASDALVQRHAQPGRNLLAILHAIQDETGFVPPATVAPLAKALNLSRAEVHGVITYYHHFRTAPPAPVTVQLCRAEACRSMGSEALAKHVEARTGCRFGAQHGHGDEHAGHAHAHAATGDVALESVYCLGQCALSPAMMINGTLHAKVSPQKFDALLAKALAAVVRTEEAA
ncbi:NAD-dependent formate dehydrogenase gamma subunit [Paraburkholderia tropica]|uniref:NAD(P)H-dependent oxidoreductase subunit E n=1 Tax=Paraburkholderia tropica TaxID=92647 RepID=UPI001CB03B15|nr:NAD(P)H-dependent oxidoreductase subunit E [Paraburkholderia tropica]CAG9217095.1 NAD-dependent formate dehydrogenase gamma subunit [Paraburkholderia tropica]